MAGIFNRAIFNNAIFNTDSASDTPAVVLGKSGDDGRRKKLHLPFKPTGLIDRPSRRNIEQRVADSHEVAAEVSAKLTKEFSQEPAQASPIEIVSISAIDREIGALLREETQRQDTEVIMRLLAACVAAGAI